MLSAHGPKGALLLKIHSAMEFQSVIKRERNRCDREASVFSVIGFYQQNGDPFRKYADSISQALRKRVRLPDEIGWFDKSRIGVHLPSTNEEGAAKIASDIQKAPSQKDFSVSYSICSYPNYNGKA